MAATDAEMEAKRKEIEAKVAAARKEMEEKEKKEQEMKQKFGTHFGITCDGCQAAPVVGYRYRCTKCKNHDLCENCHADFEKGELKHTNRINTVSTKAEDHSFELCAQMGEGFKPFNKEVYKKTTKKTKPNEPCPCNSGKKYKKCCATA